jgi:RimJ/RimL family protein N-acetyltransferase
MLIGHWYLRGFGVWALEEKATGKLVGRSGFLHPVGWPDFELGWTLARAAWGKGYATEAAEAALKHAFTVMQRPYVISLIRPDNVRSQQVATRIGETLAGECQLLGSVAQIHRIDYDTWQQRQQPLNL